jgi:hypothetical protein
MTRRFLPATVAICALLLVAAAPVGEPAFAPVQPELLAMPGSLSNAWADFDNDGDLDMAVSLKSGEIRLYRNERDVLASVGAVLGLPTSGGEFRAISWGDYDGDGWLDVYAVQSGAFRDRKAAPQPTDRLYRNRGDGHFEDVSEAAGLAVEGACLTNSRCMWSNGVCTYSCPNLAVPNPCSTTSGCSRAATSWECTAMNASTVAPSARSAALPCAATP